MKTSSFLFIVFISVLLCNVSCNDKNDVPSNTEEGANKYVNDWIYNKMTVFYYWSDKIPQKPDYSSDPKIFFKSLLNKYDKETNPQGDRFSWIQENYVDLLNSLAGVTSGDIGFSYAPIRIDKGKPDVAFVVLYPKKGSDAYLKGINRGDWITDVNGVKITDQNYKTVFSGFGSKELSRMQIILDEQTHSYKFKKLKNITVQMHKTFAENPIYLDSIYLKNNKKIGYLVFNFFGRDKGDNSYAYDKQLMHTLEKFKGVDEFILDLRYNSGGAVSTAIALASALVKNRKTSNIFSRSEYNSLITDQLKEKYGEKTFLDYFINEIDTPVYKNGKIESQALIAKVPNLNFNKLYIITGKHTASASELIINGLKPYMDVTLVGDTTYGKNVGSFSLYEKNDPKNKWGMQPIVVKLYNSKNESEYTDGFKPEANNAINELKYPLIELGSVNEPLLAKVFSIIFGEKSTSTRATKLEINKPIIENTFKEGWNNMYDDVHQKELQNIMRK